MLRSSPRKRDQSSTGSILASRFCVWSFVITAFLVPCSDSRAQQSIFGAPGIEGEDSLFSVDTPVGAIDYLNGRGLRLGNTGFTLGGFTTAEIDKEEHEPGTFELDSVNFLVLFQPFDWLTGFAEIELGDLLGMDTDHSDLHSDPDATIERLYGDLHYNDALNLRFGKFQTPVGRWNLVPAEPFVWTATEPAIVEFGFDEQQTGPALFGTLFPKSNTLSYWIYGSVVDPLDPQGDEHNADRSVGSHFEYGGSLGDWSLGTSFLASDYDGVWTYLGGLDAYGRLGPFELQSEFEIIRSSDRERELWGIYVQGVYDLGHLHECLKTLYFVGRYEHFDPRGTLQDVDIGDVGLAWLPRRFLNFKITYRFSSRVTDDVNRGLFTSFSVLF